MNPELYAYYQEHGWSHFPIKRQTLSRWRQKVLGLFMPRKYRNFFTSYDGVGKGLKYYFSVKMDCSLFEVLSVDF